MSPAHPPTEPRRAIPRPSPYDGVRVRGAEETRNVYSVDPAHLIVEAPPSRYGRIPVRDDEAAGAARRAEATAPPVLPAPEARDRAQPTLNRVEGEADATPRLTAALARLDREALYTVLDYGIERGWSCAGLRSYIIALAR